MLKKPRGNSSVSRMLVIFIILTVSLNIFCKTYFSIYSLQSKQYYPYFQMVDKPLKIEFSPFNEKNKHDKKYVSTSKICKLVAGGTSYS